MNYTIKDCILKHELEDVKHLLLSLDLTYETATETIMVYDDDKLIGTGSIDQNVIKMIGVLPLYQGQNITSLIMSELTQRLYQKGIFKFFLYTQPKSKTMFSSFDLNLVVETHDIVMFENKLNPISKVLNELKQQLPQKKKSRAALVMNCNPMTNGHLYLIEKATQENDNVLIFLVEENRSVFSFEQRYHMVEQSIKHLDNIILIPSGPYIISSITFPTYFLKSLSLASMSYMMLDAIIFKQYFMPILDIDYRYVGDEPLDPMTSAYNNTLKSILGLKLKIIERKTINDQIISASYVRKLAQEKRYDIIKTIVPKATYDFLVSPEGQAIFHG
ncbi:MAG: GNAT family N-acetyltransferase [Candidatus Izemoplasmatales bacterium]